MSIVKLTGRFETSATNDAFLAVNTANLTFITPGPMELSGGKPHYQLYFHFSGGIESMGFWVPDVDEAMKQLGK